MKVDLEVGLKMVKACNPGARLKVVKVAHLPDPYFPPVHMDHVIKTGPEL